MARLQDRRTRGILAYFARHRTAPNLVLVLMVAAGLAAIPKMRAQFFPDIVIPTALVTVAWDGAGAEDVDTGIVEVLGPALQAVPGVTDTSAIAREGLATISLEFAPGTDMGPATADVQAAVDTVTTLPEGADRPEVRRQTWDDPVTDVVVTGPVGVDQLGRIADDLVARLFAAGVTRTSIEAFPEPGLRVEVAQAALVRHDVTMEEIATAIGAEAATRPAGDLAGNGARVRTGSARRTPAEIMAIPLRTGAAAGTLRVGDVATVSADLDTGRAAFVGADPAVTVDVARSDGGDAIAIQRKVGETVAALREGLPQGVRLDLVRQRADEITARLDILYSNGLMGLGLVLVLLFVFLNARTAIWVAAGIPVSMLAALAAMHAFGVTINMISLFALILTTGIIVDDAIVVGEHADFRARILREPPGTAAETAAIRMAAPVFSSTLTTVIAFYGLVIVSGPFGSLIADIPFTVAAVLLASLVECFLVLPAHMRGALVHVDGRAWYDWPSRAFNRGFAAFVRRAFRPAMRLVVRARYTVLAGTVLLLATQAALLVSGEVTWRFFNAPERSTVDGNFSMLPGATEADTLAMLREVQRATETVAKEYTATYGTSPLAYVVAEAGGASGRGLSGADAKPADLLGSISIELIDPDRRPYSASKFTADVEAAVQRPAALEELSFRGGHAGPGGDSLSVDLSGSDATTQKAAAEALKTALGAFPEVSGLEDSLAYDREDLVLALTPQGQALGFDAGGLARVLRDRLNGIEAATFPDGPRSATIRVELPDADLTADFLDRTYLRSATGQYVPVGDLVTATRGGGFATVRRENGLRLVTVSGDVSEDDPARAADIAKRLETEILPRIEADYGVTATVGGLHQQENEFLRDAGIGFAFCLTGIFLVLAWIFSSWTRPLVVMSVIPFGLVGAIWGHYLWGVPLSMFSVVGLIGMAGIIINDSIVLVTTIDEYAATRGLVPAIVDGTCDRLRPILLTTLTTVLGLAPLLYEGSSQAAFLQPTVLTLVYGLGFGVVLVLLVVPALMAMQADVARQLAGVRRGLRARSPVRGLTGAAALFAAAAFAAGPGFVLVTGALPPPFAGVAPALPVAVAGFVAAAGLAAALAYGIGALALSRRGSP